MYDFENGKLVLKLESLDDISEGEIANDIMQLCCADIRYCADFGVWLVWDGKRWAIDVKGIVREKVKEALQKLLVDASMIEAKSQEEFSIITKYITRCRSLKSAKGIKSLLAWMESNKDVVSVSSEYDSNPEILNTPNGIINLSTGEVKNNTLFDRCMKMTGSAIDSADEAAQIWNSFINDITCGDEELASYLQAACGSALIGEVHEEKVFFVRGRKSNEANGANGKSTFFNAISYVLGDYAGTIDTAALLYDRDGGRLREEAAYGLIGKRFVVAGEMPKDAILSDKAIKSLASRDKYMVHKMHINSYPVVPTHHLYIHTNYIPESRVFDFALLRRLVVIPFDAQFKPGITKGYITNYASYLIKNCSGAILNWLVVGAMWFVANDYKLPKEPKAVLQATAEYLNGGDIDKAVQLWLSYSGYTPSDDDNSVIKASELCNRFRDWAAENREFLIDSGIELKPQIRSKAILEAIKACGFNDILDRKGMRYIKTVLPSQATKLN